METLIIVVLAIVAVTDAALLFIADGLRSDIREIRAETQDNAKAIAKLTGV